MSDTLDDSDVQDQAELQQVAALRQTAPGVYSPNAAPPPQQALTPPPPVRRPKFDPGSFTPAGEEFSFPPTKIEPQSSTWKDLGTAAWNGALGMGKDLAGAASFVTNQITSDPELRSYVGSWQSGIAKRMEDNVNSMSPADKAAMGASVLGWIPGRLGQDAQGNRIPSPTDVNFGRYLALSVSEFIPQALSFVLPETIGAKLGLWAASKVGVASKAAGAVGGAVGAGSMFGTQTAGAVFNKITDLVGGASEKEMMENPTYAQLRQAGKSDGEARTEIINKAAPIVAAFGAGAVAGAGVGGILTRGALGAADRGVVARGAIGGTEGAATMGAQGGATSAIEQQQAKGKVDLPSVMADAVAAGVQGAGFGAVGGMAHSKAAERPGTPEVDPDVDAAAREVLGPTPEPPPEPASAPMPSPAGAAPTSPDMSGVPGYSPPVEPPRVYPTTPMMRPQVAPEGEPVDIPGYSPAPAPGPPAATQAAIGVSRGVKAPPAPTQAAEPAGPRPSDGMNRQQLSEALTGQVDPKALKSMSAKDMAARYDKLAPSPEPTTVVKASAGPPTSEPAASRVEGDAAPPPSPSGVGSLPVAAEVGAEAPAPTESYVAPAVAPKASEAPRSATVTPAAFQAPVPEKAAVAVQVSKRARAKAAMQEPPAAPKPEVQPYASREAVPLEEITPTAGREVEQARTDRIGDLAEAVREIQAPRGSTLEAALRKAQRYLGEAIGKTDGSKDAVAELIHNWVGEQPTAPIPGGKITPRMVGEHLMQRVTGQRLVEPESRAAEIKAAVSEDKARRGAESKTVTGESIEGAADTHEEAATHEEHAGEGEEVTPGVKAPERKDTTDHKRVADDLIQKVIDGELTPQEASANYGKPQPGVGRKRRWPVLADRLKDWIARAEDPAVQEKWIADATKLDRDKTLTPVEKRNLSVKIQRDGENLGPEAAARMREHLHAMEDPVGHAADTSELDALRDQVTKNTKALERPEDAPLEPPGPSGIDPRSSRYVRVSQDPRLNATYERAFRASEEHDVPFTVRDALHTIVNDPLIRDELAPLHALAIKLHQHQLAPDIPVMSLERALRENRIDQKTYDDYTRRQIYGAFDPETNTILQNIDAKRLTGTHVETALHEMAHAISWNYLRHLEKTNKFHPDLRVLNGLRGEMARYLTDAYRSRTLTDTERQRVGKAIQNIHEMHTQLLTDPVVQGFAAAHQISPTFHGTLKDTGYGTPGNSSIWRVFTGWVRKSLGLDPARSASEFTLLDHVLQPVTDIVDRAAEYNKRLLPQDPTLRARGEPLYDAASSSLSQRARGAIDDIDVRGMGDRARRWALQAATSDGIVSRYTRLLPGLEHWRAAYEAITRSGKVFADKYADKVKDLTARYNKLADPKALGQLMTDATIAKAHLGSGAENPHLTTDAEKAALTALQARYARLPADAKALYSEYRDTYAAWYKQKREAQLGALVRGFMPDITDEQHEALTKALTRKSTLENFLKATEKENDATSNVAKEFGEQWLDNRKLARGIAQVHAQGFVQGDYFPLRRFGNYVVRYGDKASPGDYGVEMFENRRKAEQRRAELAAAGVEPYQVASKRESDLRDIVPNHPAIDELTASLARRGYTEQEAKEVRDTLNGILLQHATHSTAARAVQGMRRRGVLGASADQARVLSSEFVNTQVGIGHLEHGLERAKALSHMATVELPALESQNYKGHAGDAITAASVLREVEQRSTAIDPDSVLQSIGAKANTFSFAQSLMSPSHMLTASMEAHTNSMALMGARHGVFKAGAALTRALAQASPMLKTGAGRTLAAVKGELKASDWNLPELLKQRMIDKGSSNVGMTQLFRALEDANLIDHTMLKDIQQQANPGSRAGGAAYSIWARFRDFSAASAHAVDVMNKVAIAKAAFDLEYAKTRNIDASVKFATDIARKAMPNYNIGNKARIATSHGTLGALGSPLFQFKNYGLHMYTTLANLAQESMHGENKWEARKAFALMLGTHAAMAGVLGLPIADAIRYIGGAYDLITGASKPHSYENDLRQGIASVFGPQLGDLISGGLPHAAGIDVQHRVGLSNLLEIPEMKSFDAAGAKDVLFGLLTGATGENLANVMAGVDKILQGDVLGGVQAAIPRPFRDIMKATNLAERGAVTQRGRTILPAEKISPWDVAVQSVGFQPSKVTEARAGSAAVQEAHDEAQAEHTRLTNRWLQASPAERQNVMQEIRLYNQNPSSLGFRITMQQLLRDQEQRAKRSKVPGAFGLRLPAKGAQQLIQHGNFANVQ